MKQILRIEEGYAFSTIKRYVLYTLLISLYIIILLGNLAEAQSANIKNLGIPEGGLKIGDTIPEALWHLPLQVVNHPEGKDTITLNDYRGKLIILDFWATWCTGCVVAMPKTHNLQVNYKDLVILPVSYEESDWAGNFLQTNERLRNLHLFSIVNDSHLKIAFPYKIIPHYVWIDQQGQIVATTGPAYLTADNVEKCLKGEKPVYAEKFDIDTKKPLFLMDKIPKGASVDYYSLLLNGKIEGLPTGARELNASKNTTHGFGVSNNPLWLIYLIIAKRIEPKLNGKTIIYDYSDTAVKNRLSNTYTYDYHNGYAPADSFFYYMLENLNSSAGYHAAIDTRQVDCYLLTRTDHINRFGSTNDGFVLRKTEKGGYILKGCNFLTLISLLNDNENSGQPLVIDNTNYPGKIDITIYGDLKNMPNVQKELKKFGLKLVKSKQPIRVLVFP